jgi:hypothetical protein
MTGAELDRMFQQAAKKPMPGAAGAANSTPNPQPPATRVQPNAHEAKSRPATVPNPGQ